MAERVLVTGGAGFVGSRLVGRLAAEGYEVHVLERPGAAIDSLGELAASIPVHQVGGTWEDLNRVFVESRPDVVVHLAALIVTEHEPSDIEPLVRSNVLLGTLLIEAMSRHRVSRFVNTGTFWQHFGTGNEPVNLYAATKEAFEVLLRYWVAVSPLRAVTLKLFDNYGPDDPRPKLIPMLSRLVVEGGYADLSPGDQLVDLVHIDDVVDAFVRAAGRTAFLPSGSNESFAVSSGKPLPLREIVAEFERQVGHPLDIRWGGRPYRSREVMVPWQGGQPLPGWRPSVGLQEGFAALARKLSRQK